MRTILLFRHGPVEAPGGRKRCLGSRTDVPAAPEALAAAAACAPLLQRLGIRTVCCSPMLRCRQSAQALSGGAPPMIVPGLEELDCGDWDGLGFDEIQARYPEAFASRGADPALPPPGGETLEQAARRGLAALRDLLGRTDGDLAVVAHAGINRAMLCTLLHMPLSEQRTLPQDYLCVNVLRYDGALLTVSAVGLPPDDSLLTAMEDADNEETL